MEAGIHYDVAAEVYHADPAPEPSCTQSLIKVLLEQSPLHAEREHPRLWTARPGEDDEAVEKYVKAQAIGTACHAVLLGRGKDLAIAKFDNFMKGDAKKFRDEQAALGKTVILDKHMGIAQGMAKAAREQIDLHEAMDFLTDGQAEVMVLWQEDGIWFRTLIDWLHADLRICDDLKSTGTSAAPHVIGSLMADAGWCIQAAMQERGLNAIDPAGKGRRRFRFGALEQYSPYALSIAELPESCMVMGRKQIDIGIKIWKRCMKENRFPGYDRRIVVPEYPGYKESAWLTREETEFNQTVLGAG